MIEKNKEIGGWNITLPNGNIIWIKGSFKTAKQELKNELNKLN